MTAKNDEIVALNLRVPRWRRDAIAEAAGKKGQKVVRYIMDAVDVQLNIDGNMSLPAGLSDDDLAAISEQVLEHMRENGDI